MYDGLMAGNSDVVVKDDLAKFERMATQHDARQSFIESELMEAIKSYNCVTYRALAKHVNNWCQHTCIVNWLKSHETYSLYAKNIKPGLTAENQLKQVAFNQQTCHG